MEIADILKHLKGLPDKEKLELLADLEMLEQRRNAETAQRDFLSFVRYVWPAFIAGRHHRIMSDAFERIANGTLKRLIINLPPRHTKSEFASYFFPAWFIGRFPDKKIIQCSNTADLAVGFGRKVKNLIETDTYQSIFPGTKLAADSKASGKWSTRAMGEYFAVGVGGTVTGKGADILVIDDPHSEQDATQAAFNPEIYDKVYEWYTSGPRQRLQPGGAIIVVMCMTGDTDVLMADGTQRKLSSVRPGDLVATYKDGAVSASVVRNHRSNGFDDVFTVTTSSGKKFRANERHPFLVDIEGERKWARLRDLRPGLFLVGTKIAKDLPVPNQGRAYATPVRQEKATTGKTRAQNTDLWATRVAGRASRAPAVNPFFARACAKAAISVNTTAQGKLLSSAAHVASSIDTASAMLTIKVWWLKGVIAAMSADESRPLKTRALIGAASFASTIATIPERFAAFCVTTATSLSVMARSLKYSYALRNTFAVTTDEIISIEPSGKEEVFDIEVSGTENFIANGVVSHNTRWATNDLTGQIVKKSVERQNADEWEVIELPAIMPSGEPLWPEFWSIDLLNATKAEIPLSKWNAQYQQNPTSEEGALVKRDWWQKWPHEEPPSCVAIIQSWDTAYLKTQRSNHSACTTWGVFYRNTEDGSQVPNVILLDAYKEKLEFPELKRKAREKYNAYQPDQLIIEKRASGAPLIFELRRMGLPVTEFTPTRGNDKIARLNAVTDLFSSGCVWCPETEWADAVIEEIAAFPHSPDDDYVDSTTQALIRFRQGGWIAVPTDEDEPEEDEVEDAEYY
jgi:predicted phage terminase large subunit-like protein